MRGQRCRVVTVANLPPVDVVRREPYGDSPLVGERGANTQRRILEAALEVFEEHGFHDTRVELITEAAGCSRPSFYQYFSSKEEVFWRLAADLTEALEALSATMDDIGPDIEGVGAIRQWVDGLMDLYLEFRPIFEAYPTAVRERSGVVAYAGGVSGRVGAALAPPGLASGRSRRRGAPGPLGSVAFVVTLRAIHYFRLGLGQLSRQRFLTSASQTLHRLQFGPLPGVNVGPVVKPPTKRVPPWPAFPEVTDEAALRDRGRLTRERLLEAGSNVLPRRGYHDTRVDDIVEEAGVSHGTFYRYFDSKDALFRVLAQQAALTMIDLVTTYPTDASEAELGKWLRGWFDSYEDNGGVISTWQEINYDDPELAAFSLDIAVAVFDRLQRIVSRRGFGDSTVGALFLLAVVERVPYSSQALSHIDRDKAVRAAAAFIRRGILGTAD